MATAGDFLRAPPPPSSPLPDATPSPPKKPQTAGDFLRAAPPEDAPQEPLSTTEQVLLTGARVVPPIVAGIVSAPLGPLAPLVTAGVGSAAEYGAQRYEVSRGARKEVSKGGVALAAPLSIIPGAKLERVTAPLARGALRVGEGALIGGGATTASTLVEEGRLPTTGEFLRGAVTGGAFGAGGAVLEHATGTGRAAARVEGKPAETSVEGGPAPKVATEGEQLGFDTQSFRNVPKKEPPKPPLERPEPQPGEQMGFEQPSFRKVPGLHEAAFGEKPTPARPRDPERLKGEIDAVDREYAHLPPEERQTLKDLKLQQAEETAWRARETQPVQRTKDLADELVFDPEVAARKPRGEMMKAEELHAAGSHIADILDDMQPLAEHVAANPDDLAAQLQLKKKQTELVWSVSAFEGAKAEAGRALNILKFQMDALRKGQIGPIKAALKLGAKADDILAIMRMGTDSEKMKALMALRKPTRGELFRSFWMSNVLSGPKTLIRNTIGNIVPMGLDVVTTPFAAGVERLSGVEHGQRQVFAGEVPQKLQALRTQTIGGMQFGMKEAWRQASEVFNQGYGRSASWENLPSVSWVEHVLPNAPKGLKTALDYPARALAATDTFFRTMNYHMDVFGGAYAQAKRELGPQASHEAVTQRMTDIISRPTDHPELFANAEKNATRRVFQESGKLDTALYKLRDVGPMGYVIPFVRTPVAIMRQGLQLTPAGFSTKLHGLAPTARMSAQIKGEAAFGTVLMASLAGLIADGKLVVHGTGPQDPVERDKFYREGHRPNSVEFGGHSVGFSVLGPLAQPIQMIANGFDAYRDRAAKGDLKGASEIAEASAGDALGRMGKSMLDQSFVRGLSDFVGLVSDPVNRGTRTAGSLAGGFIPYAGAVRSVTQAMDPTLHQAETIPEYLKTQIPVLSESVPPRLRATGEPIQIEQMGGALGRALLPTDVSRIQSSPVEQELDTHGVRLTFPEGQVRVRTKEGKSAPLSREDESTVAQAKGQATMIALEKLITTPGYQHAKPENQTRQLEALIGRIRDVVHARAVAAVAGKRPLTADFLIPPGMQRTSPPAQSAR